MTSATVGVPPESAYLALLRAARDRAFAAGRLELQRMGFNLVQAQQDLARIAAVSGNATVAARAEGLRREIDQVLSALSARLTDHTQTAVNTTVSDVVAAHARAATSLAARAGRSDMTAGLAARYDRLNVRVLDVLAARRGGTAHTFKTLMNRHLGEAAPALDRLLEAGIARGQSIGSLTKAVATLLAGQRPEAPWSEVARLGGLSSLMYDARRIARTETMNALREANTAGLKASRMVAAAKWQTNSAHKEEDICDEYAAAEHGFGPGFWPLELWPLGPHPHCGCYQGAVKMKPPSEWGLPPPSVTTVTVPGGTGTGASAAVPSGGTRATLTGGAQERVAFGPDGKLTKATRLRHGKQVDFSAEINALLDKHGLTAESLVRRLAGGVPDTWRIDASRFELVGDFLTVDQFFFGPTGKAVGALGRKINFADGIAEHVLFSIDESVRGIGKAMLSSQVALYDEIGVTKVRTHANIDVGGYAWARYGFVPTNDSWSRLRVAVQSGLNLQEGGPLMTDEEFKYLTGLTKQDDPKAIRLIAAHPAGKQALLGSDWDGVLDLSDPLSRETFEHYVGRGKAGP